MKFFVGYQMRRDSHFIGSIIKSKDSVSEVYFSWDDIPSGRSEAGMGLGLSPWEAQRRQLSDLRQISDAGIGLNLLLNGNCYGREALSRAFFQRIGDLTDRLSAELGLSSVTTSSPVIARFLKENFGMLEVKASVNMEIGTVEAMEYLAPWFDSYYVKRELNRDMASLLQLRSWCVRNGKKLYLLANSGCLKNCSARQFHDNLVAHEKEIMAMDNALVFQGVCRDYLGREGRKETLIRVSTWIRPEDIRLYTGIADGLKLATRVSRYPEMILESYVSGHFSGNLPELMEPDFSGLLHPVVLENSAFPDDFGKHVMTCDKRCDVCTYCEAVYQNAEKPLPDSDNIISNSEVD